MAREPNWQSLKTGFVLKYELGYKYLDKCGEMMVLLEERYGYIPGETRPTGARLEHPETSITIEFDTSELRIGQDQPVNGDENILEAAMLLSDILLSELSPANPTVSSFQCQSYLPFESEHELHRATLAIDAEPHFCLAEHLGVRPVSHCSTHIFSTGSFIANVRFQEVTLTTPLRPTISAGFNPTARSVEVARRKSEAMARLKSVNSFGVLLDLEVQDSSPVVEDFPFHFNLLQDYNNKIRDRYGRGL